MKLRRRRPSSSQCHVCWLWDVLWDVVAVQQEEVKAARVQREAAEVKKAEDGFGSELQVEAWASTLKT